MNPNPDLFWHVLKPRNAHLDVSMAGSAVQLPWLVNFLPWHASSTPSRCSLTDLGLLSSRHHIPESPMSLRFHLPRLQQNQTLWHKPSEHSWGNLGLWSCLRHNLDHPVSQRFHLPKSQQQHGMWHKSAYHSGGFGADARHHHGLDRPTSQMPNKQQQQQSPCQKSSLLDGPMSPRFHLPKWQENQPRRHKSAEHLWADLGLWSCHRRSLHGPKSLRFHLPKLQNKHGMSCMWHKSA